MSVDGQRQATTMLANLAGADAESARLLLERVYAVLHRRAQRMVRGDRMERDVTATALVGEAYQRLYLTPAVLAGDRWSSSGHFYAGFVRTMQRVLIDHARAARRTKRAGMLAAVSLSDLDVVALSGCDPDVILDVHHAFKKLEKSHPKWHAVAVHRVYGGLTADETAAELDISKKTVDRHWAVAQAFLQQVLHGTANG